MIRAHYIVFFLICLFSLSFAVGFSPRATAAAEKLAILTAKTPDYEHKAVKELAKNLNTVYDKVDMVSTQDLKKNEPQEARWDALLLPNSPQTPIGLVDWLTGFAESGGDLLLLGGTPFTEPTKKLKGTYLNRERFDRYMGAHPDIRSLLLACSENNVDSWQVYSYKESGASKIVEAERDGESALRFDFRSVENWEKFQHDVETTSLTGATGLGFWARGDGDTPEVEVYVEAKEGRRYQTTIQLTPQWKFHTISFAVLPMTRPHGADFQALRARDIKAIALGLEEGKTSSASGNHQVYLDNVSRLDVSMPRPYHFDHFGISHQFDTWQLNQINVALPTEAAGQAGNRMEFNQPVSGWAPFEVPRAMESVFIDLWRAEANTDHHQRQLVSVFSHLDDRFEGSRWLIAGIESPSFYSNTAGQTMITRAAEIMNSARFSKLAQKRLVTRRELAQRAGVTHAGGMYHFTKDPFLLEGAERLEKLGTSTIKLWLYAVDQTYPFHTEWPDAQSLADIAQTDVYKQVLSRDFATFILETRSLKGSHTDTDPVREEFYQLTRHLLTEYAGSGKTFVLQNWESDWQILYGKGKRKPDRVPPMSRYDDYIKWARARQEGVERARREVGENGVRVIHAIEVNLPARSMHKNMPSVTTEVLPYVALDMVSYSAYDTQEDPAEFRAALSFIEAHMKGEGRFDPSVYVGEFGLPENSVAPRTVLRLTRDTLEVASQYGAPWIVYWQLYCNEAVSTPVKNNDDLKGFWLIRQDGTKTPTWFYLKKLCHE